MARRLGTAALAVLGALEEGRSYGFEIMDATGLAGGTVYPALARLERDDLVRSRWEDPQIAHEERRPPRRYYEITDAGSTTLRDSLAWLRGPAFSHPQDGR